MAHGMSWNGWNGMKWLGWLEWDGWLMAPMAVANCSASALQSSTATTSLQHIGKAVSSTHASFCVSDEFHQQQESRLSS